MSTTQTAPIYTDERVEADLNGPDGGYKNAAKYLVEVADPAIRDRIVREAHFIQNTSPGWNYSGAVWQARKNVLAAGDRQTSHEAETVASHKKQASDRDRRFGL